MKESYDNKKKITRVINNTLWFFITLRLYSIYKMYKYYIIKRKRINKTEINNIKINIL